MRNLGQSRDKKASRGIGIQRVRRPWRTKSPRKTGRQPVRRKERVRVVEYEKALRIKPANMTRQSVGTNQGVELRQAKALK